MVEILVVDDSRVQATVLKNLLLANSYQVRVANNGREALEMARAKRPSLVLSDVVMPEMDGYQMCREFKRDAALKDLPVILLTSLADTQDIILGLNASADSYLTKPYNAAFLLSTITSTLQSAGRELENADDSIEISLSDKQYSVSAGRRQMLSLLLSTYGNAIEQNRVLMQTQHELKTLNSQLSEQTKRIEEQQQKLEEANARLLELATHDGLTGLKNHRAFKERLEEEVRRASRQQTPLSLLLLDVDAFKTFNDTFGHPAGDDILCEVGKLLIQPSRAGDFVARYGGEEFAILWANTDAEIALILAEKLRLVIQNAPWIFRPITASFGIATLVSDSEIADVNAGASLIEAADKALYHSKRNGRNRVSHIRDVGEDS